MDRRAFVHATTGLVAAGILAPLTAACGDDDEGTSPGGSSNEILLKDNFFDPDTVTIQRGTRLRWRKTTATFHTVTPDGHSEWPRWTTDMGESFEHTFNTAGTFDYFCEAHRTQGMIGKIIVQ